MRTERDVERLMSGYVDVREGCRKRVANAERLYMQGRLTEVEYERVAAEFDSAARVVTVLRWILDTNTQEGAA